MDLSKPMKIGAFVDFNRPRKYSEEDYILPETPPFSWLLRKTQEDANNNAPVPVLIDATKQNTAAGPVACNKENENNKDGQNTGKAEEGHRVTMNQSQRPSRWSVSPTLDEEKFLKELVSVAMTMATAAVVSRPPPHHARII